jgi:hypothetical protein
MRRTIAGLLVVVVTWGTTGTATAQQSSSQPPSSVGSTEEASQHFQRAVELYRERAFDAALVEFNRAYELAPDYRLKYNIGQVQLELGDFVAAVDAFTQYLAEGGSGVSESRTAEVKAEISRIEGRIAKLNVIANVDGAELLVDGDPVGVLPIAAVRVNSGIRRVTVQKQGFESQEQRLPVTGGEEKTLTITLKRLATGAVGPTTPLGDEAAQGRKPAPPAQTESAPNPWFWISLGTTAVAAGATTTFALLTSGAQDDYDKKLETYPGSPTDIKDARNKLKQMALVTDICGAVTVVGIGATVYFAIAGGGEAEKPKTGQVTWRTGPLGLTQPGMGWEVSGQF